MLIDRFRFSFKSPWDRSSGLVSRSFLLALLALPCTIALAQPGNDQFLDAALILGDNGRVESSNEGATKEPGEPDHAGDAGGNSVWWQWTAPTGGAMGFDTFGSDFDTLLAVYTGSSLDALTLVGSNDDAGGGSQSRVGFPVLAGTTYWIAVDGYGGDQGNIVLNWHPVLPPANDHLADSVVIMGDSGTAIGSNVAATKESGEPDHDDRTGGSSVWWQWTAPAGGPVIFHTYGSDFDTVLAVYAGSSMAELSFVISNDDFGDELQSRVGFTAVAGTVYSIAVTGFDGDQGAIVLNWRPGTPPANNQFADATVLTGGNGSTTGNNSDAFKEAGEPDHADNVGGASTWWQWTAPGSGSASFDTFDSEIDTVLAIYTGSSVDALTLIGSNDDFDDELQSQVDFSAVAGVTYWIAVDGYDGEEGTIVLTWTSGPPAPEVRITGITITGASVQIDFIAAVDDPPEAFELHNSEIVAGGYTQDATASFTQLASGSFRITTTSQGAHHFFRIRKP
jgi:hypothetical protein